MSHAVQRVMSFEVERPLTGRVGDSTRGGWGDDQPLTGKGSSAAVAVAGAVGDGKGDGDGGSGDASEHKKATKAQLMKSFVVEIKELTALLSGFSAAADPLTSDARIAAIVRADCSSQHMAARD
jgi:hypothetical protein